MNGITIALAVLSFIGICAATAENPMGLVGVIVFYVALFKLLAWLDWGKKKDR